MKKALISVIAIYSTIAMATELRKTDPMLEISRGAWSGVSYVNKFGANENVNADTAEDVWSEQNMYVFPANGSASITHIRQDVDIADDRGMNIEIQGLNVDWIKVVQTQALHAANTTNQVALDTPLMRCFRMIVLDDNSAESKITARDSSGGTNYAAIQITNNQTLMAIYTVPTGKTAYVTSYYCDYVRSAAKDPNGMRYTLWVKDNSKGSAFAIKHRKGIPQGASGFQHLFRPYLKVNQMSDVRISCLANDFAANVHAGFDLILVDN